MNLKYLLCAGMFFFTTATHAQEATKLRIDPATAMGGAASSLITAISFILLESTPESIVGMIQRLEVTPQYYIILDFTVKAIFIFDKTGKFHTKIKARAISTNPNYAPYHLWYDKAQQLIGVTGEGNVVYFNTDGKLIRKRKLTPYDYQKKYLEAGKTVATCYGADKRNKDSLAYQVVVMNDTGIVQQFLPYNFRSATIPNTDLLYSNQTSFYPYNDSSMLYVRPYDFNIYQLSAHAFHPVYRFVFPMANTLPGDFFTDSTLYGKRIRYLQNNQQLYYGLDNIAKIGNNLFFRPDRKGGYIYNLKSGRLIGIDKITPDDRTHFLFLTDHLAGGTEFPNYGFLAQDGDTLYTNCSSLTLFQQKEANVDKHPVYPPALAKYLEDNKNKKGNPVIIKVKFADSF